MKSEIAAWLARKKDRRRVQVAFFGGSFTCMDTGLQRALLDEVRPFIESGLVDSIRCSTRPDCVDASGGRMLWEHKVRTVELGVQSFDDRVLRLSQRGHGAHHSRQSVRLLKTMGFEVGVQLMPGLPGDSLKTFMATVKTTIGLQPDFVRIYPTVVVRDSGLEQSYRRGEYLPLSLEKAVAMTARSYKMFDGAGIKVIRMGLQPSPGLEQSVVAGPYHPAFGQLVNSRLWFKRLRKRLVQLNDKEKLEIRVSHRDLSAVVGNNRNNIKRLDLLGYAGRYDLVTDKEMVRGSVTYVVGK